MATSKPNGRGAYGPWSEERKRQWSEERSRIASGAKRIEKLLDYHRGCVKALERTLELLTEDASASSTARAETTLAAAAALDADRRAAHEAEAPAKRKIGRPRKHPAPEPPHKRKKYYGDRRKARAHTLDFLGQFSEERPLPIAEIRGFKRALGSLVRRGYVQKTPEGYLRTGKPFEV